jgi:hypothetical protein
MIKRIYFILFFTFFCASFACAEFSASDKADVKENLAVKSVLSDSQIYIIKHALSAISAKDSREDLREVISLLDQKVNMDLTQLRLSMLAIERITYIKYTGFPNLPNNYFRPFSVKYEQFNGAYQILKQDNWGKLDKSSPEKLIAVIRKMEGFLYLPGDKTIASLWQKLEDQVKEPYKAWNKEFHRLEEMKKAKKSSNVYFSSGNMDHNQVDFMDAFGKLRNALRRLSPHYSSNF